MTTTTTTNPYPGVPLPAGADEASDWWEENTDAPGPYRIIASQRRGLADGNLTVQATALQYQDGHVDDGTLEGPCPSIDGVPELLTTHAARELAAAIIQAADMADRWIAH